MTGASPANCGLCGFVASRGVGDPSQRLGAMENGRSDGRSERLIRSGAHMGVAAAAGYDAADITTKNDWMAAVCGRPNWHNPELKQLATSDGHAEALLEGHRRFGADVLQHLTGAFSLVVANGKAGYAMIAVDRMGIEPMCWGQTPSGEFAFASTATSVRAWPGIDTTLSRQAIYDFLYFYNVPSPQTIFQGVQKLGPGCCVVFEGGTAVERKYWSMPYTAEDAGGDASAMSQALQDELARAVARSAADLETDKTGVFLSGGLDSSSIAGLVKQATGNLKTFTIGFAEPKYDETAYARISADHFGADHHEYFVTADDAADALPKIAAAYDEPFANSSAIPTYFCAQFAAQHGITTMIAGDGGDELFGGNERYASMARFDVYGKIPAALRKGLLDPVLGLPFWSGVPVMSKAQNLMRRYYLPMARRMFSYNPFCDLTVDQVLAPDMLSDIDAEGPLHVIECALDRHPTSDALQTMMGLDLTLTLADNDLRKVTRMCQLAGVGVRFPMLDDGLVDLAARMPSEMLMPGGQLRGFFKQALSGMLHPDTLTKEKHGFGLPTSEWARSAPSMHDLIIDNVQAFGRRGMTRDSFTDRLLQACQPGSADPIVASAYDLATFEMWLASH